ncbi:GntR family transcriptional regulator [Pseudonocardia nigra]|uniref:GntR family transcriptional regulator n=1 Tax=Pseudonocardia nigra TaxID=1921578 RepID=UPI001C5EB1C1|nr:GntR family transcriptional regulator [Pseudonocardia nigra]
MATFARPASRTTALVLDAVRVAIMNGDLSPGEQVRQQVWAERCGVSRPPVREALEILSNEGLLSHGLNQGYFVTRFSADEMNQLYTMRHLLEREAVATIEWPDDEQLSTLRALASDIESGAGAGRPDVAMHALVEFFLEIYRLSPRLLIVAEIERLWMRTTAFRSRNYDVMASPQGSTRGLEPAQTLPLRLGQTCTSRIDVSGRRCTMFGVLLRRASVLPRAPFAQDALDRARADAVASSQLDQRRSG